MVKVIINGICGKMGKMLVSVAETTENVEIVAGVDKFATSALSTFPIYNDFSRVKEDADILIDFSAKSALPDVLSFVTAKGMGVVLCTTGYDETDLAEIKEASEKVAVFRSANMSVGVNIMSKLVAMATKYSGSSADIEIMETHHNQKKDAPSGTALMLFESAKNENQALTPVFGREGLVGARTKNEVGIHAVRGGTVVGKHDVSFFFGNEVITIHHEAENRGVFARGALQAAEFLFGKPAGLYNMDDMLN